MHEAGSLVRLRRQAPHHDHASGHVSSPDRCNGATGDPHEGHAVTLGYKDSIEGARTAEGQPAIRSTRIAACLSCDGARTAAAYGRCSCGASTAQIAAATDLEAKGVQRSCLLSVKAAYVIYHNATRPAFDVAYALARTAFPERSQRIAAGTCATKAGV